MKKVKQFHIRNFSMIVLTSLSFCFYSCKKDKVPMVATDNSEFGECADIPDCILIPPLEGQTLGYNTIYEEHYYEKPQFNPNNDNEIIYKDGHSIQNPSSIWKFNIITNEKQLVYYGSIQNTLSWSIKDWVLFASGSNGRIYKIKSNGDSLTELTTTGGYSQPSWNYSGSKFVTYGSATNNSFVHDEQGNIVDTIDFWKVGKGSWDHLNYYGGIDFNRIAIVDIESKEIKFELSINTNDNPPLYDIFTWGADNEIIYTLPGKGLYRFNLLTNTQQLIKCVCSTNSFKSACTNRNRTKLVLVKSRTTLYNSNTLLFSPRIVVMNIDGSNEEELEIPE